MSVPAPFNILVIIFVCFGVFIFAFGGIITGFFTRSASKLAGKNDEEEEDKAAFRVSGETEKR